MKLYALIFTVLTISFAVHADDFLCPDGTRITRNTTASSISVTIDGSTLQCKNITKNEHTCNQASPGCEGLAIYSGCTNPEGFRGMCHTDLGRKAGQSDSDGFPYCYCGNGE